MPQQTYLAADLGASGGRVVAGHFDGARLSLEEAHRFDNGPVHIGDSLYWDLLQLWTQLQEGLRVAGKNFGGAIHSVGVDTWGVDYGLLGRGDTLLGNPNHYRDPRTRGMVDRAFSRVAREVIFAETGVQFMELNTLYQLLAMQETDSPLLEVAESLLMMPDLFHWLMTGEKAVEQTNASTTQLYNARERTWSSKLIEAFGLPAQLFGQIVPPGTRLGKLRKQTAAEVGLAPIDVVLPATHDTASAVVAVPAEGSPAMKPDWCYISSGTWSLMGVEVPEPVIGEGCSALNFTNEAGVDGTTRLLKNIAGLWLVQECRRVWAAQGQDYSWDDLVSAAEQSPSHGAVLDTDDPRLVAPQDMPQTIATLCKESGQTPPATHGGVIRCALESLALRYRHVAASLEQLTGGQLRTIHIVGGGSQNALLSQMTADATGRAVVTGPVEATAIGNVLMQAIAAGECGSVAEAREVIRNSFELKTYQPRATEAWDELAARFEQVHPTS